MALAEGTNRIQYTVTTATNAFNFPYKYWDDTDLKVTVINTTSGATTILDQGAGDFSVAPTNGDPDFGATITTLTSYSNDTITIERLIPYSSDASFVVGDGVPPESLNNGFDKATAQVQQIQDEIGRTIVAPSTDPDGLNYGLPSVQERSGKAVSFDVDGNVVALDLATTGAIGADTSKGINLISNVISSKVDDSTIGFDGSGNHEVKDGGLSTAKLQDSSVTKAKIEDVSDYTVLGNVSGGATAPSEVAILDEDNMSSDSNSSLATQQSIKAYIDNATQYSTIKIDSLVDVTGLAWGTEWSNLDLSSVIGGAHDAEVRVRFWSTSSSEIRMYIGNASYESDISDVNGFDSGHTSGVVSTNAGFEVTAQTNGSGVIKLKGVLTPANMRMRVLTTRKIQI